MLSIIRSRYLIKSAVFVLAAVFLSFLYTFRISDDMIFIGDQAWFYLSARDMLLKHTIPLIGIPSSHPWLHQGPLWTYILAFILKIFNFNPLSPGYFTATIGVVTVAVIYLVGKEYFSTKVGIIAAVLYATSPLIIIHNRMPYHTSLIPLIISFFLLCFYKVLKGKLTYFPFCIFLLAVLYNLELSTIVITFTFISIILYRNWKKNIGAQKIFDKKVIILSILFFLIPMSPILFFDIFHGFPQSIKYLLWILYHIARIFGFPSIHPNLDVSPNSWGEMISFFSLYITRLVLPINTVLSIILVLTSVCLYIIHLYRKSKKHTVEIGEIIIGTFFFVIVLGIFLSRTASEAYLPMLFPFIYLVISYSLSLLSELYNKIIIYMLIAFIAGINIITLFNTNYLMGNAGYGITFDQRVHVAKTIIKEARGENYIMRSGLSHPFASYTMNYEYLTWWFGNGPSTKSVKKVFVITDQSDTITLERINHK